MSRKNVKNKIAFVVAGAALILSLIVAFGGGWDRVYDAFGLSGGVAFSSSEGVSVHFIDVGQGDCALIITPEASVLIDSGERNYANVVINYIRAQGVEKLDYIVASHPHSDHIGGIGSIINTLGADRIIMPDVKDSLTPTTTAFESMIDSIIDNGTEVIFAEPGMFFNLGGGAAMEIIAPLRQYDKMNDNSVVVRFIHPAGVFLFTGDIEKEAENDITDSGLDISADVLKVAHHGSRTSSAAKFVNAVGGDYAVISVGSPNQYNHPTDDVLNRLTLRSYQILRTDLHGHIVFDCTSDGLVVYVQKGD